MRPRNFVHGVSYPTALSLCTASVALLSGLGPLKAQEQPQQVSDLPPIVVVQGATLAGSKGSANRSSRDEGDQRAQNRSERAQTPGQGEPSQDDAPPSGGGGLPLDQVGTAVTVVTGEQIRQGQYEYVADVLRGLPGVSVNRSGGPLQLSSVQIRGAESNHTLVIIDGIVVNEAQTGAFDFSNLSADNIERIEVLRGAQSGLYGSAAIGGVINIVTKDGRGPLTVTASGQGGTYRTSSYSTSISGGSDKAYGFVSYEKLQTDGFNISPFGSEKDGGSLGTFAFKGGAKLADNLSVDATLRNIHKFGDRDGFGGPDGTLATAIDDPSTFTSALWLAGGNVKWNLLDGKLAQVFHADYNRTATTDTDRSFGVFFSKGVSETGRYSYLASTDVTTNALLPAKHTISGLVEYVDERFTPLGEADDHITRERERTSYVLDYNGAFANRVFFQGSVRQDNNTTFEDFTTWRTAVSIKLPEINLRPHASAGTGVKFPGLSEQFGTTPYFIPNPNLRPEQSTSYDAGAELTLLKGLASIDVTYFNADLQDKIQTVGFPFTVVNLKGTSTREGVEVAASYKLTPQVLLSGSYTYLDARDPNGAREIRRPPHGAKADVNYSFAEGRGNLHLGVIYNGTMDDTAFLLPNFDPTRVSLDAYWLVTASASYKLTKNVQLFGRVENLLNQHYQEVYGYDTSAIAAYGGIKVQFGADDLALEKAAER